MGGWNSGKKNLYQKCDFWLYCLFGCTLVLLLFFVVLLYCCLFCCIAVLLLSAVLLFAVRCCLLLLIVLLLYYCFCCCFLYLFVGVFACTLVIISVRCTSIFTVFTVVLWTFCVRVGKADSIVEKFSSLWNAP